MKTCTRCKTSKAEADFSKHPLGRDGLRPNCKACESAYRKTWIKKNYAAYSAYNKKWQKDNAESERVRRRKKYAENIDSYRESHRARRARNLDGYLATRERWRNKNREHLTQYNRLKKARRILRERSSVGRYTKAQIDALYIEQKGLCVYCRCELGSNFHRDHILPLVLGGSNTIENIQLLCPACNYAKGVKHPDVFRALVGRRATAPELSRKPKAKGANYGAPSQGA